MIPFSDPGARFDRMRRPDPGGRRPAARAGEHDRTGTPYRPTAEAAPDRADGRPASARVMTATTGPEDLPYPPAIARPHDGERAPLGPIRPEDRPDRAARGARPRARRPGPPTGSLVGGVVVSGAIGRGRAAVRAARGKAKAAGSGSDGGGRLLNRKGGLPCWSPSYRPEGCMDTAVEVSYGVAGMLVGPNSLVPWWAWLAPLAMIFMKFLAPVFLPEVAEAKWASARDDGKGGKKGKKSKKPKKK